MKVNSSVLTLNVRENCQRINLQIHEDFSYFKRLKLKESHSINDNRANTHITLTIYLLLKTLICLLNGLHYCAFEFSQVRILALMIPGNNSLCKE